MEKNDKLKNNTQVDYETKVLEVKDLEKHFHIGTGRNRMVNKAVDNISFDIYKKEVFGIVGESGSGKTTAGRTIMKLYNPTNGTTKLNGVTIGAGYRGNYSRIRRYYREERQAIRDLDVYQNQLYILEQNAKKAIKNLEQKIVDLELSTQEKIRSNNGPIDKYKVERYTLKNNLTIDISNEEFKFEQAKLELLSKTKNIYQTKLDNEIAIEHKIYDSKKDALKESAALEKSVITKELQELDKVHNQILKDLKDKFTPLIESYHDSVLDKKIAKVEINKLLVDKKAVLSKLRNDYKDSLLQISKPDTEGIKVSNKLINENLKNEIKSLRSEIKQIRQQLVLDKKNLKRPELTDELEKELKDAIDAIKLDTKNKVQEEKEKIKELRTINNSKDSLIYSRKMQMIFQDPISSLNPRMTVKEIISEGLIILGGYSDEEITQKVNDMLITVGLSPEYAARYPHEFSGGQRQRIGIARALIMNPDFVIADEPISALDVSIRAQVINLLTNLKDELGLTILFIAHDLSVVRFFCDRIGVMFNGKIVELAPSEELFNNPMHEYTKSLLSAIPQPDPDYEKGRKRINYNPLEVHDYSVDKPSMREIAPGHQVYANEAEFKQMKAVYDKNNKVKGGTSK